jgi:predicted exporter
MLMQAQKPYAKSRKIILFSKFRVRKIAVIAFVLSIVLIPCTLLFTPIHIETDIFALLPKEEHNPLKVQAFDKVSRAAAQKLIILISNSDKETAYEAATEFYKSNKGENFLKDSSFYIDSNSRKEMESLYAKYNYHIISKNYFKLLQENKGAQLQAKSLKNIYSPIGIGSNISLENDPFLLLTNFITELPISHSSLVPYKDILMAEYDHKYYAFLAITLDAGTAFSISELNETMGLIKSSKDAIIAANPGTELTISGVPAHSNAISQRSMNEINVISIISTIFTIFLVYYCFNSIRPLVLSLFSIAIGFAVAFAATHLIFGKIHLITIVFGVSLIGIAADYSFHFFAEHLSKSGETSWEISKRIFPALNIALITTLLGYAALAFTPFPVLHQIACFSIVGLTISCMVVMILYPVFYKKMHLKRADFLLNSAEKFLNTFKELMLTKSLIYSMISLMFFSIIGLYKLTANDDVRTLSSSPPELIKSEILTRKALNQYKATQFFLIEGADEQDVLQKEEILTAKIDFLIEQKKLSSYFALSQFAPSILKQQQTYRQVKEQLLIPYLAKQAKDLGLSSANISQIETSFKAQENTFLTLDELFQNPSAKMLKPLWLGQIEGKFASVILLDNISSLESLKALNDEAGGVYFMDKLSDISTMLQKYRFITSIILAITTLVLLLFFCYRYGLVLGSLVLMPTVLSGLVAISLLWYFGIALNLFHILGLFLVLGIGSDYAVFYAEGEAHKATTTIAVFLAFATTLLSFGLLTFSHFGVLSSFGFVSLFGIFLSYITAPIVIARKWD